MERAFAQRREHIVGECVQLNTDVIVYNDMNDGQVSEIQMILDFREDVAERQQQFGSGGRSFVAREGTAHRPTSEDAVTGARILSRTTTRSSASIR